MHPHGVFTLLQKRREKVRLGKREIRADSPAVLEPILAEKVSFSSSARISSCSAGKTVRKNVMTPIPLSSFSDVDYETT
jgi:hypothetical protein